MKRLLYSQLPKFLLLIRDSSGFVHIDITSHVESLEMNRTEEIRTHSHDELYINHTRAFTEVQYDTNGSMLY